MATLAGLISSHGDGCWAFTVDADDGTLGAAHHVLALPGATWLTGAGSRWWLGRGVAGYAGSVGTVCELAGDGTQLELRAEQPMPGGRPANLARDRSGRWLIVAAYWGGSVAVFDCATRLGPPRQELAHIGTGYQVPRQQRTHAHGVAVHPHDDLVVVPDLGADRSFVYRCVADADADEAILHPADPPELPATPETGPRHAVFSADGRFLYVLGELNGEVTAYAWQSDTPCLSAIQTASAVPPGDHEGVGAADIRLHPSGEWCYANLRATRTLCRFAVAADGTLHDPQHVAIDGVSRCFRFTPDGRFLVICHTGEGVVESRPVADDGGIGDVVSRLEIASPMCLQWTEE